MDLQAFLDRYTDEVYIARDPEAARRFIADPCLRHEHGELVTMPLTDNIKRIRSFLEHNPDIAFANRVVVSDAECVVSCFDITIGVGPTANTVSGIEVFKIANGKIIETWNSTIQSGAWG
jgi:predicted SnoaL-like aldol condensation-catalyzing enzyme